METNPAKTIISVVAIDCFGGVGVATRAADGPTDSRDCYSRGLLPVSGVGASSPMTPLESFDEKTLTPGASVSVQLVRGDYSVAASGTVTFRDGEHIYAFGHPFLGLGN